MNAESLSLLEYEPLRALVGRYVSSELGRDLLAAMEPLTSRGELQPALEEASEALTWIRNAEKANSTTPPLRFDNLPDPGPAVAKLRIEGAVLESTEIASLLTLLSRAADIRQALAPHSTLYPRLAQRAASIGDFRKLLHDLEGKILPDGTVADHASVALSRIRREKERQQRLIHDSLERFLRAHRDEGVLQEEFITIRNDRFVVPLVPSAKKKIGGVVHAASGSGQTLFVEPLETIDLNNDLVRLTEEEMREVHRILREMTARLREYAHEVRAATQALGQLDFVFAKARFAVEFDCIIPAFSGEESPRLHVREARHPLLQDVLRRQRKRVVPIHLTLDGDNRILLISGPNTGGKTVAMKTIGLLSLMAQSALPVPALEAEFPVFDDVLADIGDNQSIEQSLSSFSSHIARIREMVDAAAPGCLVLLDELGRATDPEEGGALGVAILEEFRRFHAFTMASTHLLALKVYGSNTPGVVNAAMGFNEETLEPTYVLRIGAPGKSAGLDIASRLGLTPRLIARAREAMSQTQRDIATFLEQLETRIHEAGAEADELRRAKAALEERERELRAGAEKKESARIREIEQAAAEAQKRFERQAREALDAILAIPELRKPAEKSVRQVARVKREMQESVDSLSTKKASAARAEEITVGARVRLRDVGQPARVLRVLTNGLLEVEVGFLKMQVSREDVIEVVGGTPKSQPALPQGVSFSSAGPRWDTLSRELNLIGKTAEEATDEVERLLDSATLAGVTRLRIVHGHGMGVLRKAVHTLLGKHPQVDKFYPAAGNEGGTGATIVELRND
jgi:DNA mismatch repair protein MutS2